jgi:uncharacterized protein YdiU (UPF0061 family)
VMNTDNMSILGLTIDYGPYGWLENVDPDWTPNTTDAEGRRYRFIAQPQIAHWNLLQLANALFPLVGSSPPLERGLDTYASAFQQGYRRMMAAKLGLASADSASDDPLVADLWPVLAESDIDMTLFFRGLATLPCTDSEPAAPSTLLSGFADAFYDDAADAAAGREALAHWLVRYQTRVRAEAVPDRLRRERMETVNPLYVPRNYLAQLAIDKAEAGDFTGVRELLEVLRRPYSPQPGREAFAAKRPAWARHRPGCSMLSCSS